MAEYAPIRYSVSDDRIKALNARASEYGKVLGRILEESHKKIIGQHHALERILIGAMTDGHVLVESVPGLAKTMMIKTMARVLGANSVRIQFTPDLLPADVIGTKIYRGGRSSAGTFVTQKGPIFHNFVLADEINRAPPKVQSALLEAMQEGQVTIHGDTHALERPFLVFATQNPIESEGTYRLPEAQIDRFAMKIVIEYPTKEEEIEIIERNAVRDREPPKEVSTLKDVVEMQEFCEEVYVDRVVTEYAADITSATRRPSAYGIGDIHDEMIELGASPRASIWLVKTARARALLEGRGFVIPEDVKEMARDVLRHRVMPTFEAESQGVTPDAIIGKILDKVNPP